MIASGKSAAPPLRMSKRCFLLIVECGQWPAELLFEHYLEGSCPNTSATASQSSRFRAKPTSTAYRTSILLDEEFEQGVSQQL